MGGWGGRWGAPRGHGGGWAEELQGRGGKCLLLKHALRADRWHSGREGEGDAFRKQQTNQIPFSTVERDEQGLIGLLVLLWVGKIVGIVARPALTLQDTNLPTCYIQKVKALKKSRIK